MAGAALPGAGGGGITRFPVNWLDLASPLLSRLSALCSVLRCNCASADLKACEHGGQSPARDPLSTFLLQPSDLHVLSMAAVAGGEHWVQGDTDTHYRLGVDVTIMFRCHDHNSGVMVGFYFHLICI